MKMSYRHIMAKVMAVALASVTALASCTRLEDDSDDAVGYLAFPSLDIDVTVDNPEQTKALDGFTPAQPVLSDVVFDVKEKGGDVSLFKGTWPMILTAGKTYIIEASVGSNTFGSPYFHASEEVTIEKLVRATPSMTLTLGNSLVRVTVGPELDGHFLSPDGDAWSSADKVTLTSGAGSYDVSYGTWTYVPSGESFTVSLSGVNSVNAPAIFSYVIPTATAPKTGYDITCGKDATDWPTITIPAQQDGAWANRLYITPGAVVTGNVPADQIEYEAIPASSSDWSVALKSSHVQGYYFIDGLTGSSYKVRARIGNITSNEVDVTMTVPGADVFSYVHHNESNGNFATAGGNLDGTNAGLDLGISGGILGELNSKGLLLENVTLAKGDGTVVRTTSSASTSAMNVAGGWTYLPEASDYKLTIVHKLVDKAAVAVEVDGISVTAPAVKVTLGNSFTSYDEYVGSPGITKSTANANTRDPETLYSVSASWNISTALMNNEKYAKSLKFKLDYLSNRTKETTYNGNLKGVNSSAVLSIASLTDWTAYNLTAVLSFAGKDFVSSDKEHHITGLPYEECPKDASREPLHPWTEEQDSSGGLGEVFGWGDSEFYMYDNAAVGTFMQIASPEFNVPVKIGASMIFSAHGYFKAGATSLSDRKYDVDATIFDGANTEKFTALHNKMAYLDYPVKTLSLLPSYRKIRVENSEHTNSNKLYINRVTIHYRDLN